jgi:hypothetical protein
MSNKHRHGAPEAPKASSAPVKPTEPTSASTVVENASTPEAAKPEASTVNAGAPEAPKASSADGAEASEAAASLGSISELERTDEGKPCPNCTEERPCSVECYVAAGYTAEGFAERFGTTLPPDGAERVTHIDPSRRGKPLPDGAVMVRALRGVVVRVQHRDAGDVFWMLKSRPEDGGHHLGEYAEEYADRGDVELL